MRNLKASSARLLPLGSVAHSLAVVGGATAIGQGVVVLAAPVLSRLYDPEAFGGLSVFIAMLSVLLAVASLRYDLVIPMSRTPVEAAHVLAISAILPIVLAGAIAAILLADGAQVFASLGAPELAPYGLLLPGALIVGGLAQPLASWAIYERTFGALARMRSAQGISQVLTQVVLGMFHLGTIGLLVGDFVGRVVGLDQIARSAYKATRAADLSLAQLRRTASEHWPFARVMTSASLLNALSLQIPFLLIPLLFDLSSSGQYFLAYRVLVLPASLVAAAVSQVFFGEAAHARHDSGRLHDLALNASVSLLIFSLPTYAIIAVAGPGLIRSVFGSDWATAGLYAQISAPWLILWTVANPISTLLLVGRRERESLAFTAAELTFKTGALLAGAAMHSLTTGIAILSVVSVAINLAALWRFLRVASVRPLEILKPAARICALSGVPIAVVAASTILAPASLLVVSAAAWLVALALSVRLSHEPRALLSAS